MHSHTYSSNNNEKQLSKVIIVIKSNRTQNNTHPKNKKQKQNILQTIDNENKKNFSIFIQRGDNFKL